MLTCNHLRKARINSNLSLTDAAMKLNMSKSMLHRYEFSPISKVPCSIINKLAAFYQVTPSQLLNYEQNCLYSSEDLSLILINSIPLPSSHRHFLSYYERCSSLSVKNLIKQYQALDIRGKHMVSLIIRTEYNRISASDI